jgi:TP901 family phage tail tape measure protein
MAKANVSASLAGVDRQQYEAMLTAVMDVGQQGADVVGTAFKSLFSRYGNVKSGKYSKTYTGDTEIDGSTTALNDVETVLNKIGITTRETVGEFRDMYDVLEEIATKWRTLDEVS